MKKLTPNQQEFERQLRRIKRLMRQSEKEGITFMRSPLPERPKRITKQRLELISRIKKQTVQEYPSFTTVNPEADITKLVKKHKKLELSSPRKHGTKTSDYILLGRKGRKKGSKNKNHISEETRKKLSEARKNRKKKPPTEKQKEAWKKNLEKARKNRKPLTEERKEKLREQLAEARKKPRKKKPPTEKQKEAWKKNLEKAREKKEFLRQVKEDNPFEPDEQFRQQEVEEEPEKPTKERQKRKPRTSKPPKDEPFEPESQAPEEYPEYPHEDDVVIYNVLDLLETGEYYWHEMGQVIVDFAYEIIDGAGEHDVVSRLKEASDDMMNRALNLMHYDWYDYDEAYNDATAFLEILAGEQGIPSSYIEKLVEIKNRLGKIVKNNYWLDEYGIRGGR